MSTNAIPTGETPKSLFSQGQLDMLSRGDQEMNTLLEKINTESLLNNQNGVTQAYWSLVRYISEAISLAHLDFMESIKTIAISNYPILSKDLLVALREHKDILEHYDFIKVQVLGRFIDKGIVVSDRRKSTGVVEDSKDAVGGIIRAQ